MSRIAKKPIPIPKGVSVTISEHEVVVKGAKATIHVVIAPSLHISQHENVLIIAVKGEEKAKETKSNEDYHAHEHNHEKHQELVVHKKADMIAGTTRALINNAVHGVSQGFELKLELIGVGYRAQAQGKTLNLTLGFSHPVNFAIPEGVTAETPTQTEVVLKSFDKALLGQVAANIRALRPPEHYKGKGIRFVGEKIILKETKKK